MAERTNIIGAWQTRLSQVVDLMRTMSKQTDPQEMVRVYAERVRDLVPIDRRLSLSRRGLERPWYRITRSTTWTDEVNPWRDKDRLPLLKGGLLADLIYGDEPVVIDELEIPRDDPAFEHLQGMRSLSAIPMYDQGVSLNMVIAMRSEPAAFDRNDFPQMVWMSNLFGRATGNLVLSDELNRANQALDREMKAVGRIQRLLLPAELPTIATLDLAAHYQPSHRAGGDYYDFFPLPEGRWGIFIADVSGHGSPAAVLMAVTHCIAHTRPGDAQPPGEVLAYLNRQLATLYTSQIESFVTAFYGVYDPQRRTLTYACAGHPPPRLKRCADGTLLSLDCVGGFPLGVTDEEEFDEHTQQLVPGDQLVFYTDGITEAANPQGRMFGVDGFDRVLENCTLQASSLLDNVLEEVERFADGRPADDDRTVIVARVV